jgi:hypothetical protein
LPPVLAELGTERVFVAGTATEMCVFQTALEARRSRKPVERMSKRPCLSNGLRSRKELLRPVGRSVGREKPSNQ